MPAVDSLSTLPGPADYSPHHEITRPHVHTIRFPPIPVGNSMRSSETVTNMFPLLSDDLDVRRKRGHVTSHRRSRTHSSIRSSVAPHRHASSVPSQWSAQGGLSTVRPEEIEIDIATYQVELLQALCCQYLHIAVTNLLDWERHQRSDIENIFQFNMKWIRSLCASELRNIKLPSPVNCNVDFIRSNVSNQSKTRRRSRQLATCSPASSEIHARQDEGKVSLRLSSVTQSRRASASSTTPPPQPQNHRWAPIVQRNTPERNRMCRVERAQSGKESSRHENEVGIRGVKTRERSTSTILPALLDPFCPVSCENYAPGKAVTGHRNVLLHKDPAKGSASGQSSVEHQTSILDAGSMKHSMNLHCTTCGALNAVRPIHGPSTAHVYPGAAETSLKGSCSHVPFERTEREVFEFPWMNPKLKSCLEHHGERLAAEWGDTQALNKEKNFFEAVMHLVLEYTRGICFLFARGFHELSCATLTLTLQKDEQRSRRIEMFRQARSGGSSQQHESTPAIEEHADSANPGSTIPSVRWVVQEPNQEVDQEFAAWQAQMQQDFEKERQDTEVLLSMLQFIEYQMDCEASTVAERETSKVTSIGKRRQSPTMRKVNHTLLASSNGKEHM